MIKAVIGLIVAFCFYEAFAQRTANQFRRVDIRRGLSNNHVNSIHSDRYGFIWIATRSGLNRFDGLHFSVFRNDPENHKSLHDNNIHRIFEDHMGYLWFFSATGDFSIYNPRYDAFSTEHPIFNKPSAPQKDSISSVKSDKNKNIWISTFHNGLYFYDADQDFMVHFVSGSGVQGRLSSNRIMDIVISPDGKLYAINQSGVVDIINIMTLEVVGSIDYTKGPFYNPDRRNYRLFIDNDGDLWIYSVNSGDGLYYVDIETGKTRNFTHRSYPVRLSHPNITGIVTDNEGRIWVGTELGGINIIDKSDFSTSVINALPGDETSLSSNSITSIYKSPDGIIWIGTFKNGVNYYHENLLQFPLYRCLPHEEELYFSNDVNSFAEDSKGNLWIGTNDDGLVYYDRKRGSFRKFQHDPGDKSSLSGNVIVSLFADHDGKLWVGTYLHGLNLFDGRTFKRFVHDPSRLNTISDNRIWHILRDSRGQLWVATLGGGLNLYDPNTEGFVHYRAGDQNSVNSDFILHLFEDSKGNLWIGTSSGLNKLDANTGRFIHFEHNPDDPLTISHNVILTIIEDAKGYIWVGTRNGLNLFDPETETFSVYFDSDGLPDNNIISMEKDEAGNIWIATQNGISRLSRDSVSGVIEFQNFSETDGLQGKEFNEHSSFRTSRGEIIFGGANGFNIFDPSTIRFQDFKPTVIITNLKLFNSTIEIGQKVDGNVVLPKAVSYLDNISIRHNQEVFTVEFASPNFFNPEMTRFRYMLQGFNDYWIETDVSDPRATFTNLDPGTYTFKVAAQNSKGEWGQISDLKIEIIPPFYSTTLAFAVYIMITLGSVAGLIRYLKVREKLKFARKQERLEYQRMCELDAMKTQFFTNVSHEFRTPLTMILTPVEKLLHEVNDQELYKQLNLIGRNGRRLLNLVNQLLDFRKLEVSGIQLNLSYGNIIALLKESFASFFDLFENKHIEYEFLSDSEEYFACFDQDKIEKIIFNLLSNAMKFTSEHGKVQMIFKKWVAGSDNFIDRFQGKEYVEIKVTDNGIGIPADRQKRIFDTFYQYNIPVNVGSNGSGIGLSLVHEFVKMHQGIVNLESEPGKGSCFTILLPLETQPEPEGISIYSESGTTSKYPISNNPPEIRCTGNNTAKPLILIVDDNEDLRFYLRDNLRTRYEILEAPDGQTGWETVINKMPDIVISDILMPVQNGLWLCRKIKSDNQTSHIPVILLTARIAGEQKIEGFEAGAEDYITKPFNYELLQLKIQRLLELRLAFQKVFSKKMEIAPGEIGITSLDQKFLAKALKITEDNIGNPDFSVELMSRNLGVSRGHLYNKLMALTGKSPVEFIRIMRLKRGAQLLGKSQLTVSEIAFNVGFNDPKYFTKYFKEEYGMVPSEFAKTNL